jgi:ATPase family associated with various cellular activities (AAA)
VTTAVAPPPSAFSPELHAADDLGAYWLRQVAFRLRREVAWRWHERRRDRADASPASDRLVESLDLVRHWETKQRFFAEDTAAAYLSQRLAEPYQPAGAKPTRGSFGWVVEELELDEVSAFTVALALITTFDSAAAPVVSACLNDPARTQPTLELAQRLWERPEEVLLLADSAQPLWRLGILELQVTLGASPLGWDTPLVVAPLVAAQLLFPDASAGATLPELEGKASDAIADRDVELTRARLEASAGALRVIPVQARPGAAFAGAVTALAAAIGCRVRRPIIEPEQLEDPAAVRSLLALTWLLGDAIFLPPHSLGFGDRTRVHAALVAARSVPVTVFLAVHERSDLTGLPPELLVPPLPLPPLSYERRLELWRRTLTRSSPELEPATAEAARRFRYEEETIRALAAGLNRLGRAPTPDELLAACRAEVQIDCGDLAQLIEPRFEPDELVLPLDRRLQLEEIHRAMVSLTKVHYEWGTARAWNEGGIAVLFAGPPGTGKTMAAEILARRLQLPMYRIDLSQVVDKYIGVTEKNLKRLFDAAEVSDLVLFFDEADALFGRRTEVRDSHDRYANLEISYLLERMERFRGLAILATNRRKDLDEAFVRRLRFIVEFPLPDAPEREEIWRRVIPAGVDASAVDVPFLAGQFPLAGAHIRSIVFNACLQTAAEGDARALSMENVVIAVKREYDKLKRSVSLEQFGPYAPVVEALAA